jgi:hypothetical protein
LKQAVSDFYGAKINPFPANGKTGQNATFCTNTHLVQHAVRKSLAQSACSKLNKLKLNTFVFWHADC